MGFLDKLFASHEDPADRDALADFWYRPAGRAALAGVNVTETSALHVATVLACVKVLSETISTLPAIIYSRRPDGGKEREPNHPLYDVVHSRPNVWQTSAEFWQLMVVFRALWGNAYAQIVPGGRGFADQLLPLNPDWVTPEVLPDHRMRFKVRQADGTTKVLLQNEVFRIPGLSLDGRVGLNTVRLAREIIGLALAAEGHAARFFGNGARPAGVLESLGDPGPTAAEDIKKKWKESYGGLFNANDIAVLHSGLTYKQIEIDPKKSQNLETRKQEAIEICQVFRVPPHKVAILDKATFSNITEQEEMFVRDTIAPWCTAIEQAAGRDLILRPDRFFMRFLLLGLLRGDPKTRSEFYTQAITNGWMTRNEVRQREDMNPLPGLDEPLVPLNMGGPGGGSTPDDAARAARLVGHYREMVRAAAARVVRRETAAVAKAAQRHADDAERFNAAVTRFYEKHSAYVQAAMHITADAAAAYCERTRAALESAGLSALDSWETEAVEWLTSIAMGEKDAQQAA